MNEAFGDWLLLWFSLFTALVATFPAVQNRSPTFMVVLILSKSKSFSLTFDRLEKELKKRISGHQLVLLSAKGRYIRKSGRKYLNTTKGMIVGAFFKFVKKALKG